MRQVGTLRQVLLVALTAIAAITIGRALREAVDKNNAPTPAPTAAISAEVL